MTGRDRRRLLTAVQDGRIRRSAGGFAVEETPQSRTNRRVDRQIGQLHDEGLVADPDPDLDTPHYQLTPAGAAALADGTVR